MKPFCFLLCCIIGIAVPCYSLCDNSFADLPPSGEYRFSRWAGKPLKVLYRIPPTVDQGSRIVIVMPGAKRNGEQYRSEWDSLAVTNNFILVVIEANLLQFPSEYEYNLGGVIDSTGEVRPRKEWLLTAIDKVFVDFKKRSGSAQENYILYGHSAGGCLVLMHQLFLSKSHAARVIAGNPAFFMLPSKAESFPFGLQNAPVTDLQLDRWYRKDLVLMLGDRDREQRTHELSNSEAANSQGPHVFARGLKFFQASLCHTAEQNKPHRWTLEIVPGVGHSNAEIAPHAVKYFKIDDR